MSLKVRNYYIGESNRITKCFYCNLTDITRLKFHTGHIISESSGSKINRYTIY